MYYKCNYCDPKTKKGEKPVKSIDTEVDEFVKDDNRKYYHIECYKSHLRNKRSPFGESVIQEMLDRLIEKTKLETKESIEKDKFLKFVMDFYDGSLPSYFLKKLQSVRDGSHESISEPISYETLLDIYQYMQRYLEKVAASKKIENTTQRMNYDLAVVLGNYGDYKKFKRKQEGFSAEKQAMDRQIEIENKLSKAEVKTKNNDKEDKEFDITDVIDELLL